MSHLQVMTSVLECDGCSALFGVGESFRTAMSVRVAAGGEGWTFPNQINDVGNSLASSSDVCPACTSGWTAQVRGVKRSRALKVSDPMGGTS